MVIGSYWNSNERFALSHGSGALPKAPEIVAAPQLLRSGTLERRRHGGYGRSFDDSPVARALPVGGDEERWIEWQFEITQWSRRHDRRTPDFMARAGDQTVSVEIEDMTEEVQLLAGKLMSDLAVRTQDRARRLLMTVEDQSNGFEAWRRLSELGQRRGRLRKVGL